MPFDFEESRRSMLCKSLQFNCYGADMLISHYLSVYLSVYIYIYVYIYICMWHVPLGMSPDPALSLNLSHTAQPSTSHSNNNDRLMEPSTIRRHTVDGQNPA